MSVRPTPDGIQADTSFGSSDDAAVERDGFTRDGLQRWRVMLATPDQRGAVTVQERNRRGASWRMERRKAEGVESMGGTEL